MSFVIEKETVSICALCGKVAETRPYGADGADICFSCMMKNEDEGKRRLAILLNSPEKTILS